MANIITESLPDISVLADTNSYNTLLKGHGVPLLHYKASICPLGLIDANDVSASHSEHVGCENGYIYNFAGEVTAFFSNNAAITNLTEMGLLDGSVVNVTFPENYNNSQEKVYVQLFDRFFIKNLAVLVPNTQLIETHVTGWDKANYKIVKVESIIDSNGFYYTPDNYEVNDGKIHWVSAKRPGFDPQVGKGIIYSVRYLYSPYFYCSRLLHEVRLLNKVDYVTNENSLVRAPYQAFLNREFYQYKQRNNSGVLGDPDRPNREMFGARDGMWGPA